MDFAPVYRFFAFGFWLFLITVPLSVWKLIEIGLWLYEHFEVSFK